MYSYLKYTVLRDKKDVDILSAINDSFYDETYTLNYKENGFNIAAAFTEYDSETEDILPIEYGEIVFMHYFWGPQEDGSYATGRRKIKS